MIAPAVSLHVLPPHHIGMASPAIGHLKGYVESQLPMLTVKVEYWNQFIIKRCLDSHIRHLLKQCGYMDFTNFHFYWGLFANWYLQLDDSVADLEGQEYAWQLASLQLLRRRPNQELFRNISGRVQKAFQERIREAAYDQDDIVGCSTSFGQTIASLTLMKLFKTINPQALTVLGGTVKHEAETLMAAFSHIDVCVFGEGEGTFAELCTRVAEGESLHDLRGAAVRTEDGVVANKPRSPLKSINGLWANWDGFDWDLPIQEDYPTVGLPIVDSRGCPWARCAFCDVARMLNPYRERSPECILDEIEHQLSKHRCLATTPTRIWLSGAEVGGGAENRQSEERLQKLLTGLVALRRNFPELTAFVWLSPYQATDEVLRHLNELEAFVQWGFEQWSGIIKRMGKMHQIEDAIYTLKLHDKYPGVKLLDMNMLVGFPGETLGDVYESQATLQKLRFILAQLIERGWISPIPILIGSSTRLGRSTDVGNPLVQEAAAHEPMAQLLNYMAPEKQPGADVVLDQTMLTLFDTGATGRLGDHYARTFNESLETTRLDCVLDQNGEATLSLVDEYGTTALRANALAAAVLQRTERAVLVTDLCTDLSEHGEELVKACVGDLESIDLLYFNAETGRCINTLPHGIQLLIDTVPTLQRGGS